MFFNVQKGICNDNFLQNFINKRFQDEERLRITIVTCDKQALRKIKSCSLMFMWNTIFVPQQPK